MTSRVKNLITSATVKDTSVLFVGSIVSNVFAIIFTILFGRYLGPENLAIGTAVVAFVAITIAIGDLGLGSSLFRYVSKFLSADQDKKAENMLRGIFSIRIKTAVALLLLLVVLSPFISPILFKYNSPLLVIYAGIATVGYLIFEFQTQVFQSRQDFNKAAVLLGSNNVLRLVLLVLLHKLGLLTLLSAIFIFAITSFVVYLFSLKWHHISLTIKSDWKRHTKRIGVFSGWMGTNRIFGAVAGRIDALLLLQFLSVHETGIFAAARQLSFGVPVVIGSFATVLAPRFASLKGRKLKKYFTKSIALSGLISLGLFAGVFVSPFVISLFGDKFTESVRLLQWLLIGYIPFVLATPATNILIYAYGKPKIIAAMSFVNIIIVFSAISFLSKYYGVYAPVIASALTNINMFLVSYYYSVKYLRGTK